MNNVNGFLIIDKPVGLSSFEIVRIIKTRFKFKKVGHTGTLDPFASGVLVIAINSATKLIQFLNESEKEYEAEFQLGLETDTDDLTGEVINRIEAEGLSFKEVESALGDFLGEIIQKPPLYSAKKIKGKSAYKYARQGKEVELKPTKVKIFKLELLKFNYPNLELRIKCSKGTYIRAIARDLGKKLGVGGMVKKLRRNTSGDFKISEAVNPDKLSLDIISERIIKPISVLSHINKLNLKDDFIFSIKNGVQPQITWFKEPPANNGIYLVSKKELLVILDYSEGIFRYLRVVET